FTVLYPQPLCFPYLLLNHSAGTDDHTLSLHDALPIYLPSGGKRAQLSDERIDLLVRHRRDPLLRERPLHAQRVKLTCNFRAAQIDRKSTRLNSSHVEISYAVFCLKKKIQSRENTVCRL